MPHFKKAKFSAGNKAGAVEKLDVDILISASGEFYAHLPNYLELATDRSIIDRPGSKIEGKFKITATTLAALERGIQDTLNRFLVPEVTEEAVIRYNIESHVAFAEDADGNIFPNASWPGAAWQKNNSIFGGHHATEPAKGGYSLAIGARAMLKTTYKFGDNSEVKYAPYYKGASHLGHENPAQLLNSWSALTLGNNPKEIPYTDEAALFFHSLLMGMAQISRQIQAATFQQENLLALIAKQSATPLLTDMSLMRNTAP